MRICAHHRASARAVARDPAVEYGTEWEGGKGGKFRKKYHEKKEKII